MKQKEKWLLTVLLTTYFILRIIKLTDLPIFNDEVLYLNWIRIMSQNPIKNAFFSLKEGFAPLHFWLLLPIFKITSIENLLFFTRLLSVLFGLANVYFLFLIGKKQKNTLFGFFTAIFYILSPFAFWYDRLVMRDNIMFFWGVLIFYFLQKKDNKKNILLIGIFLGLALLTKSTAYFYVLAIFINLILKNKAIKKNLTNFLIIIIISFSIFQILRLSENFDNLISKNSTFLISFNQFIKNPFILFRNNFYSVILWLAELVSVPILLMAIAGIIFSIKKNYKETLAILSWGAIPIAFEVFFAKIFFPRYFLIALLPIFIFAGKAFANTYELFKHKIFYAIFSIFVLFPNINLIKQIYLDLPNTNLPQIIRWQYIEGWPSGFGLKKSLDFIENNYLKKRKKVVFITEKTTLANSSLSLFFDKYNNKKIKIVIPTEGNVEFSQKLIEKDATNLVLLTNRKKLDNWPIVKVFEEERPGKKSFYNLYEINLDLVQK